MSGIRQRFFCGALLSLLSLGAVSAAAAGYAGRPIVDVLEELRGTGLDFIYSSELLPRSLTVAAEPESTNRLLIAREILAARGLSLAVVRPGLFAVTVRAAAPERLVRGRIIAAADARAIPNASVRLDPIGAVDWADEQGRFRLGPVPDGSYTLRVEADGFQPAETARFTVAEGAADAEIRLAPSMSELSEIVVATSRYGIERFDGSGAMRIEGEALAAQPVPGEDVMRALARLPGMAQGGLTAQANIRGGEAGELLTLLDGFPVREVFHLSSYHDVFGLLDPTLIGDAEVYTGGFPVRYGNRMAGVFDLTTLDPRSEPHTALGLSVFNAMARNGSELDARDLDWLAMGRIGTLKPFIRTFAADAGSPSYGDVYARLGWGEPSRLRVTTNVLWSRDDLEISREPQGERAQFESENRYFWLRGDRIWPSGVEASLHLGHSSIDGFRVGTIDNPGVASGSATDRRSSKYWDWRGRLAWQPDARNWVEGGFEWIEEDADYRYAAEATFTDAVADLFSREPAFERATTLSPSRERMAFFAAHRWQALDQLVSELGLRAQRTITAGTVEDWLFDPRLNLRWQILPSTSVRAHWGRFHQTDEVHELKVEDGLTAFPEAQRSDQTIVGIDHRHGNGLALRLEWFRKLQSDPRPHFENMLDPMSLIPEIAPDRVEVAPLAAEVRGVEVSAAFDDRDLDWWVGIVWSEATDNVAGSRVRRSWDQTWAVTAGIDWVRGNWRFGAVAGSHRGWPMTRVAGDELGARNGDHFPVRATLDLRAEYRKPLAVGNLAVTVEVSNAVNIGNVCCQQLIPEDDGAGGVTFTTRESDWLPVVPSIGVLWEF
jgi:TonB dependent receptor/Carboxypeptidase regulatory-like domain/TonB-dependent Receptor Plug Domain